MNTIADLKAEIENNKNVTASANLLLQGIAQRIADATAAAKASASGVDATELDALVTQLQSQDSGLAAAVAANTQPTTAATAPNRPVLVPGSAPDQAAANAAINQGADPNNPLPPASPVTTFAGPTASPSAPPQPATKPILPPAAPSVAPPAAVPSVPPAVPVSAELAGLRAPAGASGKSPK